MKSNELRIGNYVHLFEKGFYKVHTISRKVIQVHGDLIGGEVFDIFNIQPIQLTPEIIEKCNFEKHLTAGNSKAAFYSYRYSITNTLELAWYSADGRLKFQTKLSGFSIDFDIQYLHQLQNLVFALTGKELKFDL